MKRFSKTFISLGLCAGLLTLTLAGCGSKTNEIDPNDTPEETSPVEQVMTPVTLNEVAHSIFYAPMYVAIEEGYFEEIGIDLELVTGFGVS